MHFKEKQYISKKLLREHENLHLFIVKKSYAAYTEMSDFRAMQMNLLSKVYFS